MPPPRLGLDASRVLQGVLGAALLFLLVANGAGHLSYDSLAQLREGRTAVRETWGPTTYAWILGIGDGIVPGTGVYVVVSATILFACLSSLSRLRPSVSWWAVPAAVLIVLSPQVLIYQAIVWKDVLFANLAVAGFVSLAHALRISASSPSRTMSLVAAGLSLATGTLVRANGAVVVMAAAITLGAVHWRRDGASTALRWSAGGFLGVVIFGAMIWSIAEPKSSGPSRGVRVLQHYDIVGAVALDPTYPLSVIRSADPQAEAGIRAGAAATYSPERVDFLADDLARVLWSLPRETVGAEWRALVVSRPLLYLTERWDVFRWVFLTPELERCLPFHIGIDGPDALIADLGLAKGIDRVDAALADYARRFFGTPVFSHAAHALVAALVAAFLLLRRDRQDVVIAGLLLSALAFTATFFVTSIACDYRYLYFLDLAAMTGVLYAALDPSLRRRGGEA